MLLLTSTHYNSAPPASSGHPVDSFDLSSPPQLLPLLLLRGGQRLNWPGSQQVDEGEQRLNWPGSLQVVELLFTSPWWSSSLLTGGAVFVPEELFLSSLSPTPSYAPPSLSSPSVCSSCSASAIGSGSMSSGSAAGEVAVGARFCPVSVFM